MTPKKHFVIHGDRKSYVLAVVESDRPVIRVRDDMGRVVDQFDATPDLLQTLEKLAKTIATKEETHGRPD